jgi:hypothetical protein
MRELKIRASRWQEQVLPTCDGREAFASSERPRGLIDHSVCRTDEFLYHRLGIEVAGEPYWYLYALSLRGEPSLWVLGVFDTPGQVDFFLALHNDNPLKVPALRQLDAGAGWLQVDQDGILQYPHYSGVYQVGLKSYRVEPIDDGSGRYRAHYADRDHIDYLGEANEKEICLKVYSHFDGRLRGCKLC